MDQVGHAVMWLYGLYILNVLLPVVPAFIIFKFFPATPAKVRGLLGRVNINVSGAMAAYVIAAGIGYSVVVKTETIIGTMASASWSVTGQVELQNTTGKPASNVPLSYLSVAVRPDVISHANGIVEMSLPAAAGAVPNQTLIFTLPGFGEKTVKLGDFIASKDEFKKSIKLKPVMIQQWATQTQPSSVSPVAPNEGPALNGN